MRCTLNTFLHLPSRSTRFGDGVQSLCDGRHLALCLEAGWKKKTFSKTKKTTTTAQPENESEHPLLVRSLLKGKEGGKPPLPPTSKKEQQRTSKKTTKNEKDEVSGADDERRKGEQEQQEQQEHEEEQKRRLGKNSGHQTLAMRMGFTRNAANVDTEHHQEQQPLHQKQGRPSRDVAKKVVSYKEPSLLTKMRRPSS
jgi:hypothetical protein